MLPEAFLLLPSSPGLAEEAAGFAPPKVDAHGPHVLLSEPFPGQRFFLQKQSPACSAIKASTAYITVFYASKTQNTPQSPFLPLQTHIFCLHLSPFAQTWDWWLSTVTFGLDYPAHNKNNSETKPNPNPLLSANPFLWDNSKTTGEEGFTHCLRQM